jgi:hypothetical protein
MSTSRLARAPHRVAACAGHPFDAREVFEVGRRERHRLPQMYEQASAGVEIGGGGRFGTVQPANRGADALFLEIELAAAIAFAAQAFQAVEETFQPPLPAGKQVRQLAATALRHQRHRLECLFDDRVLSHAIGENRQNGSKAEVDNDQGEAQKVSERQAEHVGRLPLLRDG